LPALEDKAIFVDFDGGRLSSDGGLILLNDPDDQIGLTRDLAAVLRDPRDPRHFSAAQLARGVETAGQAPASSLA
jgi:hypothetical protein